MKPHDLYGLPLEEFTAKRNALAKELRADGRRDEAAAVSKLRKPSVAAWAVNQLVRTQQREVEALFEAGDALQKEQAEVLAKRGDAASLRNRMEAERAAAERLTDKARGLLNSDGHELTPARLEQVSETLHAAALDQDARAQVTDGCLERELRHIGLGGLAAAGPPPGGVRPARREDRRERLKAAREAEVAARCRLEAAAQELRKAERRREQAAAALREAEEALAAARQLAADAEEQHRQAKQTLEET